MPDIFKRQPVFALEVEDAYLKWREAANRVTALESAPDRASKLADTTMNRFAEGGKVPAEDVVRSSLVSSQAQASYNEALYQYALGLAALERVTAGGVDAGLVGETPAKP